MLAQFKHAVEQPLARGLGSVLLVIIYFRTGKENSSLSYTKKCDNIDGYHTLFFIDFAYTASIARRNLRLSKR